MANSNSGAKKYFFASRRTQSAFHRCLIAPCGMNCSVCVAYLRAKNNCPGCRADDKDKPKTRTNCKIKTCINLKNNRLDYCFSCTVFPCDRINHLDARYKTKYSMSMIKNLFDIKKSGIRKFIEKEKVKWTCPDCGSAICVHKALCSGCGKKF